MKSSQTPGRAMRFSAPLARILLGMSASLALVVLAVVWFPETTSGQTPPCTGQIPQSTGNTNPCGSGRSCTQQTCVSWFTPITPPAGGWYQCTSKNALPTDNCTKGVNVACGDGGLCITDGTNCQPSKGSTKFTPSIIPDNGSCVAG